VSEIYSLDRLQSDRAQAGKSYLEFLRVAPMSAGLYVLPVGATDRQSPHDQDEVYYVISGAAKVRHGQDERRIQKGDVIFVEAKLDHRFFDIEEELVLLVVFAPAEQ